MVSTGKKGKKPGSGVAGPPTGRKKESRYMVKAGLELADDEEDGDEADDGDGEYLVEAVESIQIDREGKKKYLVKWLGYDETTWEDEGNVGGCQEMIQEFTEMIGLVMKSPADSHRDAGRGRPKSKK